MNTGAGPAGGVTPATDDLARPDRLRRTGLRSRTRGWLVVLSGLLALLVLALPVTASAASCPNEEVRAEQGSERLPDCRAFELVTPEVKADNGNFKPAYGFPDGNHVEYSSVLPMPGAESGSFGNVLGTRTASGWVNTSLAAPASGTGQPIRTNGQNSAAFAGVATFTGDFSQAFVDSGFDTDPMDQDAGAVDAYRLDLSSGAWSLAALPDTGAMTASLNPCVPNTFACVSGVFLAGVSENGSHVFFQTFDQLPVVPGTPGEPHPGDMLYDRTGGHTYMVGVLPGDTISETCIIGLGDGAADANFQFSLVYGAISPDGSNVVFTAQGCGAPSEGVYLRENNATTIKLAGVGYVARSSDGSKVFTAGGGEVFEYDVATGVTRIITTEGGLLASSADGSRVYYLNSGGPNPGLYLWDKGTSVLIPNAGEGFASPGPGESAEPSQAIATPDGSKLLFLDLASLTGYDNFGAKCANAHTQPGLCAEAYVYDATTAAITCVSCNPTGAPPLGGAELRNTRGKPDPLLPAIFEGQIASDGSRVFFETSDPLVPQDTNGLPDVYEWENGREYLISSGQGTAGSTLSGVSSNGNDVFITTADRLAQQDIESSPQIYDARVAGGFPYRPFIPGCDSGQCQGPQTPVPLFGAPASATFVGLGNPGGRESNPPPVKPKPLTRAQKLTKALKACRTKHNKAKRLACEKGARNRYGHRSPSPRRPKP
jgi:hypothetical protein